MLDPLPSPSPATGRPPRARPPAEPAPSPAPTPAAEAAPVELDARGRLEQFFDPGTFFELDRDAHHRARLFGMQERHLPGDGVVTGYGEVDGRTVFAFSQDRRVLGGSLGEAHAQKIVKVMGLAAKSGAPLVGLNDSGGARIQEGVEALAGYGQIFRHNVALSGVVPQISLVLGPCAGGAVYSPALTDFVIMVRAASYMFVTGPKVVAAVTGEAIDVEALGGAEVHARKSGVAHFVVDGVVEALLLARRLLGYLPSHNCQAPPQAPPDAADPADRPCPELTRRVPREPHRPYEMAGVVAEILDRGSFLEVKPDWATSICVGLGRLDGMPVGVVGNNPAVRAGVIDIDAARKAAQWVRFCDSFGLPVISLVDVPGFLPGREQEHAGIIDHGAKLAYAYCEAQVPKLTVILRKAYGGAYIVMGSKTVGGDLNLVWPTAQVAVMGAAGASEILHARAIRAAAEPDAMRQQLADEYDARFASPEVALARGLCDALIEPAETRWALVRGLRALVGKREPSVPRRHGNVPL